MKQNNWEKHERFYIPDGDLTLLIDGTLFRVHKYILCRDSPVFSDMLAVPPSPQSAPEGSIDGNPIKLLGQSKEDLESYLQVVYYPATLFESSDGELFLNALRFADKWSLDTLKHSLFKKITSGNVGSAAQIIAACRILGDDLKDKKSLVTSFLDLMSEPPADSIAYILSPTDLVLTLQLQAYYKGDAQKKINREKYVRAVVVGGVHPSDMPGAMKWNVLPTKPPIANAITLTDDSYSEEESGSESE